MNYILELNAANQLSLPGDLLQKADLKPGSHFEARLEGNRVFIEQIPFSSFEEARIIEQTVEGLENKRIE